MIDANEVVKAMCGKYQKDYDLARWSILSRTR